ncbi:uncharacterized protein At4g18490 isoform X4 [Spinacia oleracea]|uniref:Uncharacterized protein At4g18490 isoform X4 n=1 Tax=Spinacia oleracea TaxID=3562 RepID=A0ABM3QUS7_SPIOL|nr:uncharacterized protein At4g18490 isoform X4 [Spinacia oleracea]
MADSEKKDSSKSKMSLLDEDFSKDFLGSWKSGGDDMDFDFEPVSKGKKKAFDFGMDMDFNLDDAFGKMSSFKMDLPDIDFCNSPKKSMKSKDKLEEVSAKGNCQDKHDKFNFSFDFNGMNTSDEENEPGDGGCFGRAKVPSKTVNASETSVQATNDGGTTENSASEDNLEGSTNTGAVNRSCSFYGSSKDNGKKSDEYPSSSTKELIQSDSVMENSGKHAAAHAPPRNHDGTVNEKNRNEVSVGRVLRNGKVIGGSPSLECEKKANNVKYSGDMDFSVDDAFGKMSSVKKNMPNIDFSKSPNISTTLKEKSEEDSAKGNTQDKHDKFTFSSDSKGISNKDGKNEPGDGGCLDNDKLPSDTVKASATSDPKALSSNARSRADMEKPVLKVSSAPFDRDMDFALDDAFGKMSSVKKNMPNIDFSKSPNKSTMLKEKSEEDSAKGNAQEKHEKFTFSFDSNGMNTNDGKNELDDGGCSGSANLPSDTVKASATSDPKALSSNARSRADMQKPVLNVSSAPFDCGSTAAKTMLPKSKVQGAMNSNILVAQETADGDTTTVSASEGNQEGTTHTDAVNRSSNGSSKHSGKKLENHPSSFTKELIQSDSVMEKSEKDAAARTPPRDHDDTVNEKTRNEGSVDTMPYNGEAENDGLASLECEKMTRNVQSSCFKIPSPTPQEQGTKFGNQGKGNLKDKISSITLIPKLNTCQGNLKDKIPSIAFIPKLNPGQGNLKDKISSTALIPKLNIGQGNKLPSQRIDKRMLALPSLKITRRTTTDKHSASPTMLSNAKSLGNVEKSTGPKQVMIKKVSPIVAEKQTPSTPSLKRKRSEAADRGLAKLHTPKRFSPNESRMTKVSVRIREDGVQNHGNFVVGNTKNVSAENKTPKFHFDQEANMASLQFSLMVENDANVEKAEACAKELDNICNMLKKKHEEAKELLVRALVNNNNLLMLSHPIHEEKICAVQRLASKLMSRELEVEA